MRNEKLILVFSKMDPNLFSAFLAWFAWERGSTFKEIFRLGETCKAAHRCVRSLKFDFLDLRLLPAASVKPILKVFKDPIELLLFTEHFHEITSPLPSVKEICVQRGKDEDQTIRRSMKELLEKFPQATRIETASWGPLVDWSPSLSLEDASVFIGDSTVVDLPLLTPNVKMLDMWSREPCDFEVVLNERMKRIGISGYISPTIRGKKLRVLSLELTNANIDVLCEEIEKVFFDGEEFRGRVQAESIGSLSLCDLTRQFSVRVDASVRSVCINESPSQVVLHPHMFSLSREDVLTIPLSWVDDLVSSSVHHVSIENKTLFLDTNSRHNRYKNVLFNFSVKRVHICVCKKSYDFKIDAEEIHVSTCPKCKEVDWMRITKISTLGRVKRDEEKYLLLKAYASAAGLSEEDAVREMGLRLIAFRMTGKETPVFQH